MKKYLLLSLLVIALISVMTGCGEKNKSKDKSPASDISSYISDVMPNESNNTSSFTNSENITSGNSNNDSTGNTNSEGYTNNSGVTKNITKDKAKEIAFQHAGVKEADIRDLEIDIDRENGIEYYDVDFEVGNKEYEYHINTKSGEIIHSNKKNDSAANTNSVESSPSNSSNIIKDRAKEIAFQHAGVKEADIRDLEIDIDRENAVEYYDISFESGNKEYEYHINTKSGEIIHSNVENDDDY